MVTIKDIAAQLGVSASTVGRALADDPRISGAMKQRVQGVASELGYVANRAARMMRGVSSKLVGLIVPDIRNTFYSTIAHSLSKCLEPEGYQLMLSETDDDRSVELRHVRELVSVNVAGMILVPSAKPLPEMVRLLKSVRHVQLLRELPSLGGQRFGMDDRRAIELGVEHLIELGHRRIAYIGPTEDLSTGAARLEGYRNALKAVNAWSAELEACGAPTQGAFGAEALRRLVALKHPPSALVLGGVQHTQGVLDECIALGLQVPEQLSVVGFGDEPGFRWWNGGLTTINVPVSEMATSCGLWFLHQLQQPKNDMPRYRSVSAPSLVHRCSTRALDAPVKRRTRNIEKNA